MLKPEQAEKQLKAQFQDDWGKRKGNELKDIPHCQAWLRALAEEMDLDDALDAESLKNFRLSSLTDEQRQRVFTTLFPKLADAMEWVWTNAERRPYAVRRFGLKPFRGLRDPRFIREQNDCFFRDLIKQLSGYDPDAAWLATWGQHIEIGGGGAYIQLLSAVMCMGGARAEEARVILKQSASNQHPIAVMGPQVIFGLLSTDRPDDWEFIGKLLLAAQRQEGLRDSILAVAPLGHPGAFSYLLQLVLDEDLVRFASTVNAMDGWFGFMWDAASSGLARSVLERTLQYISDEKARAAAIAGKEIESAYIALWCEALHDVHRAEALATKLLDHHTPEKRALGVHALDMFCLQSSFSPLIKVLEDRDMNVAASAFFALSTNFYDTMRLAGFGETSSSDQTDDEGDDTELSFGTALFNAYLNFFIRLNGQTHTFKPLVFPWGRDKISSDQVAATLTFSCPERMLDLVIPHLDRLPSHERSWLVRRLSLRVKGDPLAHGREKKPQPMTPEVRKVFIQLLGDSKQDARRSAAEGLSTEKPTPEEIARHEELLQRSAGDIRAGAIKRLLELPDEQTLASVQRLLQGTKPQKQAGLEVFKMLIEAGRSVEAARTLAGGSAPAPGKASSKGTKTKPHTPKKSDATIEQFRSNVLSPAATENITEDNAFGLAKSFAPRPLYVCKQIENPLFTKAAVECIWSLEDLIEEHKTLELKRFDDKGQELPPGDSEHLLGGLEYTYAYTPDPRLNIDVSRKRLPFGDLLDRWEASRPAKTRDADGLELLRAWILVEQAEWATSRSNRWPREFAELTPKQRTGDTPKHFEAIELLVKWACHLSSNDPTAFFLDQMETAAARRDIVRSEDVDYHSRVVPSKMPLGLSVSRLRRLFEYAPGRNQETTDLQTCRRLEGILRAADTIKHEQLRAKADRIIAKNSPTKSRDSDLFDADEEIIEEIRAQNVRAEFTVLVQLWKAGDISDDELLVEMTRSSTTRDYHVHHNAHNLQRLYSSKSKPRWQSSDWFIEITPKLEELIERVRRRVMEIELSRGDADTPATPHTYNIDPSGGIDVVIPALAGLGKHKLVRGCIYNQTGKAASMCQIIRCSRPTSTDTKEAFASAAKAASLSEERLVELAAYQPRWASFIEHALAWDGLEEAVLWFRSHTRERQDSYDDPEEKLEDWEVRASELTPLHKQSLVDGAVDRAWFERCRKRLGAKRWAVLYEAAKYSCGGAGHTRARLFADAMDGQVTEKELVTRITTKRHQDSARALGLLEIKPGEPGQKQVLSRFKVLQEMLRTSRKHGGSMLQASEKRAVEIGMENLAWTAGYPDPLRLQWAMEIEEFGELAKGPMVVKVSETTVQLAVDDQGVPELSAVKAGKALKSVPPAVKKDKKVAPLIEKLTSLRKQTSRVRQALEQAMCRGDVFEGGEISTLFGHPMLKSMLSRLVFVGQTKAGGSYAGYPDKGGKALRSFDGSLEVLKSSDTLRIAHPLDLLATKRWTDWQTECFKTERVQPFKQVFREVYVPLESELQRGVLSEGDLPNRYAGQQVQPRQALALFTSRGWVARPEEGVQRTFHRERITVHVRFEEGFYTPAEIDGLTIAGLAFSKAGSYQGLAVRDVPPRLFSEIMRDLDLVVSVAHRGGVDPEASHSTVEMRAALLRETCELLALDNVSIKDSRAFIKGQLAEYALHLGSGTIHQMPGGTVWVVPVHSQYRGRIFLPFADDDPKTAEIISKALLLARDHEIQDPAILAQLGKR